MKKTVSIGFLGNLNYDTRTFNLLKSLKENNFNVIFNGFDWLTPGFKSLETNEIRIKKLVKNKLSILFYLSFAFKLLRSLLKQNADIYFASDLYSLPFCVIAAKLKGKKIFYDSREVYTGLPALNDKKIVKALVRIIESHYIHKTDLVLTTGKMDSDYIEKLYNLKSTEVLRNLPLTNTDISPVDLRSKFQNPGNLKLILYQGIIVKGRGIEIYFEIIKKTDNLGLIILGGGEDEEFYKKMAEKSGINDRVLFAGKIKQNELLNYTAAAELGLSIITNISTNNYYALPNKLFEYLMAGIPVIASDMPQMKEIIEKYKVGEVVAENDSAAIIKIIQKWSDEPELYTQLKENCKVAAKELNWENEFGRILDYFN